MIPEQRRDRLVGCCAELKTKAGTLINRMELLGIPMMVAPDGGYRSLERQKYLYLIGRKVEMHRRPVTNADGVHSKSLHQRPGRAVDCIFRTSTPYEGPWDIYIREALKLGFVRGPEWDKAHVQLP